MDRYARVVFALLVTSMVFITGAIASADGGHAEIGTAVHAHVDPSECRYARADGRRGVTDDEARRMLRCAEARWPVDGGLTKLFSVVACESGFNERALNPSSGAGGLYQFLASTWDSARSRYRALGRRMALSWSRFNARASAVVGTRYASEGGWGPWSCA